MTKELPDLSALDKKIAKTKRTIAHGEQPADATPAKQALRIGADLVAGVAVGMTIGWYMDDYFSTQPLFIMLGLGVGFFAGMKLMISGSQIPKDESED